MSPPVVPGHRLSPEANAVGPNGIPAAKPVKNHSNTGTISNNGGHGHTEDTDFGFATPRKPPRRFFNGLDSPAGAMLLMSPAITGRRRPGTMSMMVNCHECVSESSHRTRKV